MAFVCRTYLVPPSAEDDAVAELWSQGTLGVEIAAAADGRLQLRAYFSAPPPAGIDELPAIDGAILVADGIVEDRDWHEPFRTQARPFELGARFVVDPGEPGPYEAESPGGRRLLRLPARAAFGTGSHESTALAVELLEDTAVSGRRVLDVGTGTGILALAALALGASSALAFDLDLASPFHARDNARLNGSRVALFAGSLAALRRAPFDLALANLIAEQLLPELAGVLGLLAPQGAAIVSGLLAERAELILAEARRAGFVPTGQRTRGEWVAFRLARPGRAG